MLYSELRTFQTYVHLISQGVRNSEVLLYIVCMYEWMKVCMYEWMNVCMNENMYVWMNESMYVWMNESMYVCIYWFIQIDLLCSQ